MKHLAVITARSGSKGLKDKNIKLLEGKPLRSTPSRQPDSLENLTAFMSRPTAKNMHRLRGSMERMCRFCVMRHLPRTLPGPGMC